MILPYGPTAHALPRPPEAGGARERRRRGRSYNEGDATEGICGEGEYTLTTTEQPITRSELREELRHYATKADLAEVKAELANVETRLIKWMLGQMVAAIVAASSIALLIQRLLG